TACVHSSPHIAVNLRVPSSFPTRRSSDLPAVLAGAEHLQHARRDHVAADRVAGGEEHADETDDLLQRRVRLAEHHHRADQHDAVDRKSTRLNSSHVKNSYAVFCLITIEEI